MVFASLGAVINEDVADPGSLNSYFQVRSARPQRCLALTRSRRAAQRHGCYYCDAGDCNNLRLDCWALLDLTDRLGFEGEIQSPPRQELVANVTQGISATIGTDTRSGGGGQQGGRPHARRTAHVHHSGHFVLLTGWDPASDSFKVHDPFYNSTHYPYANISDAIVYRYTEPLHRPVVPHKYPGFKQCAQPWARNVMVRGLLHSQGEWRSPHALSQLGVRRRRRAPYAGRAASCPPPPCPSPATASGPMATLLTPGRSTRGCGAMAGACPGPPGGGRRFQS